MTTRSIEHRPTVPEIRKGDTVLVLVRPRRRQARQGGARRPA